METAAFAAECGLAQKISRAGKRVFNFQKYKRFYPFSKFLFFVHPKDHPARRDYIIFAV